jgi:hypothetical protein
LFFYQTTLKRFNYVYGFVKIDKINSFPFWCSVVDDVKSNGVNVFGQMQAERYITFRLAMSVTGEYCLFWRNKALTIAAINNTMTRVNGVF